LGYEVDTARDGAEGATRYEDCLRGNRPYAAVIMDLTIRGGMGGKEAMEKLKLIDPHVRAIVSSGYSDDPVMARFEEYGFSGVISKPYDLAQVAEVLKKVITPVADE